MTAQMLIAIGSGSLVGFTLGLVGGSGSILATPLLLYAVQELPLPFKTCPCRSRPRAGRRRG
ncbi:putative membrane protein YfcA [Bosea sp. BE125]|nr:putative membrane protein YfcA [Bosea sp. BE125]